MEVFVVDFHFVLVGKNYKKHEVVVLVVQDHIVDINKILGILHIFVKIFYNTMEKGKVPVMIGIKKEVEKLLDFFMV